MAKVSLNKALTRKALDPVKVQFGDIEVEVLQYLPIDQKSAFITEVMSASIDDNGIFSPVRIQIYVDLNLIKFYTNFNLTDKMLEETSKTYDLLCINGIIEKIHEAIPKEEYNFLINSLYKCIADVRRYNNSAMGVMKQIATDYQNTDLDVSKMFNQLGDPEQFALVRDVLKKLG